MTVQHEIKAARAQFKAVTDAPAGTFEAIVSVFGNVDLGGDRVMPGAFAKTLAEWQSSGDPIPVIWSHEWDDPMSHIGYVEQAEERPEGLYVRARLDVDNNQRAAYVARLLKERRVREFSFGYYAKNSVVVDDEEYGKVRQLTEIDLFEVGPTLLGMNPETILLEAASRINGRKATAEETVEGAFATWIYRDDQMLGRIEHVMTDGVLGVPESSFQLEASAENPAVLLRIFDDTDAGWVETEMFMGARSSDITIVPDPRNVGMASADPENKAWRVGADRDLAIAERDSWDGDAAAARVFAWAGFDGENPDAGRASRAFLVYDDAAADLRGSYKLGFADVIDGELYAIDAGLRAAASRLPQTDAPADVLDRARGVLDSYFARLEENSLKSQDDASDDSRDTPPTIDNERLLSLLARPKYTEE